MTSAHVLSTLSPASLAAGLAHTRPTERRSSFDLHFVDGPAGRLVVKVGEAERMRREAAALERARLIVGVLAPACVSLEPLPDGRSALAIEHCDGEQLAPGNLSRAAFAALARGLIRLHRADREVERRCPPREPDFVTLSLAQDRYASFAELAGPLACAARRWPGLTGVTRLHALLLADLEGAPERYAVQRSFVHADIWPENLLVHGDQVWLIDWAWLKRGDPALDLAAFRVTLDWVWPARRAHLAFERLVAAEQATLDNPGLARRLRFYLPAVLLIHLVQFAEVEAQDAYIQAAMRACLATAQRERVLWSLPGWRARLALALAWRPRSEYDDPREGVRRGLRRAARRALRGLARSVGR